MLGQLPDRLKVRRLAYNVKRWCSTGQHIWCTVCQKAPLRWAFYTNTRRINMGHNNNIIPSEMRQPPKKQGRYITIYHDVEFVYMQHQRETPLTWAKTNLEHASLHGEHADIEGSAPQVEDDDVRPRDPRVLSLLLPVKTVSQGGSRGLVDDAAYVESLEKKTEEMKQTRGIIGAGWVEGFDSSTAVVNLVQLFIGVYRSVHVFPPASCVDER